MKVKYKDLKANIKERFHDFWVYEGCWNKTLKALTIKEKRVH